MDPDPQPAPVQAAEGVTDAERYLAKLCRRSFLSLWSYPGVFRDQGRTDGKGDGKEVCDLLVVFDNHVIIFSDKDCHFQDGINLRVAWARWFRKAVLSSAKQVWGAERWIRDFPTRLFLDRKCTKPFPINLPKPDEAIFHRIVVAHDASRACKAVLGGSGSLMLNNTLIGDAHLSGMPFMIGRLDENRGYVHVFDDTTLQIVMSTLDTVSDFTAYLVKKEKFLTSGMLVSAAGEEHLLATYLKYLNKDGEHDFGIPSGYDAVSLGEEIWENFANSPERKAQIAHNAISYAWDQLIEKFAHHLMTGTQYFGSGHPVHEQEVAFRFMAREPRTRRRMLAISLHEVLDKSRTAKYFSARVMQPDGGDFPHYVFLFMHRAPALKDDEYRNMRMHLLSDYCAVTKLVYPEAKDIIGLASEAGLAGRRSEDLIYLNARDWTERDQQRARKKQDTLGILKEVTTQASREYEYPVDHEGKPRRTTPSRNSPCPCGSGLRYKRCHGLAKFRRERN